MKQLLIILSILLLSSPVIGESKKSETFYEWKTASGIQWREIGDKDIHAEYNGDVKVLDRMKKVGEDLLDIDKESGGLLSSLEKKEDSKTNEMTS